MIFSLEVTARVIKNILICLPLKLKIYIFCLSTSEVHKYIIFGTAQRQTVTGVVIIQILNITILSATYIFLVQLSLLQGLISIELMVL